MSETSPKDLISPRISYNNYILLIFLNFSVFLPLAIKNKTKQNLQESMQVIFLVVKLLACGSVKNSRLK